MKILKLFCLFGVLAEFCAFADVKPIVIANRHSQAMYSIVVPNDAPPSERYAAEELQRYVERLTGVNLKIAPKASGAIVELVYDEELGDAFELKVVGINLVIRGGARGILYGVYEILETYGGVGWFSSWHEVVPKIDALKVPGDLERMEKPAFEYRETSWFDAQNPDFATRLRLNGDCAKFEARHGSSGKFFGNGKSHSLGVLVPRKEFFETHPEYFAYDAKTKKRVPEGYCLSNPEVLSIVIERLKGVIERRRRCRAFAVGQPDVAAFCECEQCAKIIREGGARSAAIVQFVNAVADEIAKVYPDVIIETLAYQPSRMPPNNLELRANVMPCYCTMESDKSRPLVSSPALASVDTRRFIKKWREKANRLMVWNYTTYFVRYLFPYPNVLSLGEDIRYFRDLGVVWLTEQGAYQGRHAEFAELKAWIIAKMMWNPDQPLEPLLDRFFKGYYGKAAPFARRYFDELHRNRLAWAGDDPKRPLNFIDPIGVPALTDEWLISAEKMWRAAEESVKRDDAVYSYNVKMSALPPTYVLYLRENRMYDLANGSNNEVSKAIATRSARAGMLLSRIREGKIRVGEFKLNLGFTNELYLVSQLAKRPKPISALRTGPAVFASDVNKCSLVADSKADSGLAWKLEGQAKDGGKRVVSFPWSIFYAPNGTRYKLRIHVRADFLPNVDRDAEAITVDLATLSDEKASSGARKSKSSHITIPVRDLSKDWRWIALDYEPFDVGKGDYFQIAIPFSNGKANVQNIYIDSIELVRK